MATFTGTTGADVADAGAGAITGFTGGSIAELQDGAGDVFRGEGGADTIRAGGGDDTIFGGLGADVLVGNAGADIFAYESNAEIGADRIDGGAGGAGGDTLRIAFTGVADFTAATFNSTGTASIENLELLGAGHDILFNGLQYGATALAGGMTIKGDNSGADIITFMNAGTFNISLASFVAGFWDEAVDRIVVNGNDLGRTLTGSRVADTLNAGGGDDTLDGGLGDDLLDGGADRDTADYGRSPGGVTVFLAGAGDGFALVTGSAEQDTLRNIENLIGGAGKDALVGDGGANLLSGAGDNDFLFANGFNPDGTLKTGAGSDTLNGDAGNDGLFAGDGADTLNGGAGDDGLVGGAGDDTLNGGAGTDFLFGGAFSPAGARLDGSGADTLNGGDGNDGLYGFDGADTINGDAGDDYVEGGAGADTLNGGAGSDFLLGQDGDTINGGAGFDYMFGGAGADTFIFRKGDSADWILDFSAVDGDKLKFEGFGYANFTAVPLVDLSIPGHPAVQLTFIEGANVDQLTIFGVTPADLNAANVLVS